MKKINYSLKECADIKHRADHYANQGKNDDALSTYCECLIAYSSAVFSRQITIDGVFQLFFYFINKAENDTTNPFAQEIAKILSYLWIHVQARMCKSMDMFVDNEFERLFGKDQLLEYCMVLLERAKRLYKKK